MRSVTGTSACIGRRTNGRSRDGHSIVNGQTILGRARCTGTSTKTCNSHAINTAGGIVNTARAAIIA